MLEWIHLVAFLCGYGKWHNGKYYNTYWHKSTESAQRLWNPHKFLLALVLQKLRSRYATLWAPIVKSSSPFRVFRGCPAWQ